jgi:hypothetical protein
MSEPSPAVVQAEEEKKKERKGRKKGKKEKEEPCDLEKVAHVQHV